MCNFDSFILTLAIKKACHAKLQTVVFLVQKHTRKRTLTQSTKTYFTNGHLNDPLGKSGAKSYKTFYDCNLQMFVII